MGLGVPDVLSRYLLRLRCQSRRYTHSFVRVDHSEVLGARLPYLWGVVHQGSLPSEHVQDAAGIDSAMKVRVGPLCLGFEKGLTEGLGKTCYVRALTVSQSLNLSVKPVKNRLNNSLQSLPFSRLIYSTDGIHNPSDRISGHIAAFEFILKGYVQRGLVPSEFF